MVRKSSSTQIWKKCVFCSGKFEAKKPTAKFCCTPHRIAAFRRHKKMFRCHASPAELTQLLVDEDALPNEAASMAGERKPAVQIQAEEFVLPEEDSVTFEQ